MKKTTLILLIAVLPFLAGCFGAAAVGVGAGALVFADRRQAETIVADEGIELRAVSRIGESFGSNTHVNVTSYNRTVLLTGEAHSAAAKGEIEKLVAAVPNVKAIQNELQVAAASTLTARSNDTYITSKVKARFIDANKFAANHVKVVTEAGVVYLLGLVTQTEAAAAVDIARTTAGVQKVVRVFEIISASAATQGQPAPAAKPAQ